MRQADEQEVLQHIRDLTFWREHGPIISLMKSGRNYQHRSQYDNEQIWGKRGIPYSLQVESKSPTYVQYSMAKMTEMI